MKIKRVSLLVLFIGIASIYLACTVTIMEDLTVKSITPAENSVLPTNTNTIFKAELEYEIGAEALNYASQYQIIAVLSGISGSYINLGHKIIPHQINGNSTIEFGLNPTEVETVAVIPYKIFFLLMDSNETMILGETRKYIYNKE